MGLRQDYDIVNIVRRGDQCNSHFYCGVLSKSGFYVGLRQDYDIVNMVRRGDQCNGHFYFGALSKGGLRWVKAGL